MARISPICIKFKIFLSSLKYPTYRDFMIKKSLKSKRSKSHTWAPLKGQCHEIFGFWFFSWISFPKAPEYFIRAVLNFFENSRRYSQLKVDHRYQRHRLQNCRRYQRHRWQICHWYQRHRQQILPPVSLVLLIPVSTIPAANLPPVSTIPVANCHRYQRHWRQKTMGLISGCRYLKVNLKAKMYICVNSTIQRCPNKIIKIYLIEDFSHLPPVSTTPVVNLELRIYRRIFEKI
jgi:hypothetical protein